MDSTISTLAGADLLTLATMDTALVGRLFETAVSVKKEIAPHSRALAGRSVILLFEKPSLRTRVTFELGPGTLGGAALYFDHSKERIGQRESIRDYAKNLERWVDLVVARVYSHDTLVELAKEASIPIVNALSDLYHPCQALADYFTLYERFGGLRGFKLAYIGDGNNVCHSLMHGAALLGVELTVITPKGYEPSPAVVKEARAMAASSGATITLASDPAAVAGAQAVYTDTWVSMGKDDESAERQRAFTRYQVNEKLMTIASPKALFMHCMPAHRGHECTDAVIDSAESVVYDQAENRLHVQNALLLHILAEKS